MTEPGTMPSWINNDLIQQVLQKSEKNNTIRVVKVSAKAASAKGDNYTSEVLRLTVDLRMTNNEDKEIENKRSLIIKIAHTSSDVHKELVEHIGVVELEIKMMSSTLMDMEKILGDTKLCGKCLYGQENPPAIIIEDLGELGFRMADRHAGLDFQHALLAIRNLAKFHASSVAIIEKDPSLKKFYGKGIFFPSNETTMMKQFFSGALISLAKAVGNWSETGKIYEKKLMKIGEDAFQFFTTRLVLDESEFNVLNHGDCWVNNMLFHYDKKNQVDGQIFVDFQLPVYKSPALDLQYFMNSSLPENGLINDKDRLLKEYFNVLTSTMKRIGCKTPPPSVKHLGKMMQKYEIYGLFAACICLPIMTTDQKDVKSLDELVQKDGTYDDKGVTNPEYLKRIFRRLEIWNEMGLLDI